MIDSDLLLLLGVPSFSSLPASVKEGKHIYKAPTLLACCHKSLANKSQWGDDEEKVIVAAPGFGL